MNLRLRVVGSLASVGDSGNFVLMMNNCRKVRAAAKHGKPLHAGVGGTQLYSEVER